MGWCVKYLELYDKYALELATLSSWRWVSDVSPRGVMLDPMGERYPPPWLYTYRKADAVFKLKNKLKQQMWDQKKEWMLNVQIYTYALKFDLWVAYSKLVVYALLKLAPTMSWMCVNVCVGRVGTGEGTLEVDFTGVFPWKETLRSAVVCVSLSCSRGETGTSCASCGRLRIQGREE